MNIQWEKLACKCRIKLAPRTPFHLHFLLHKKGDMHDLKMRFPGTRMHRDDIVLVNY